MSHGAASRVLTRPLLVALLPHALLAAGQGPVRAQSVQVDRSTPRTQNGLTLLAVTRGDAQGQYRFPVPANLNFLSAPIESGPSGGLGLWVRSSEPARPSPGRSRRPFPPATTMPAATGRAADGETLPVQCQQPYSPPYGGQASAAPLYFLSLPGGYPAGYGPIDVTLTDPQGHRAHWRLAHLPRPYHAIAPPVAVHSTFSRKGVTLQAKAWRDDGPAFSFPNNTAAEWRGVRYQLTGGVPPKSQWVVHITDRQLEWEPLAPSQQRPLLPPAFRGPHGAFRPTLFSAFFGQAGPGQPGFFPQMQDMIRTPYASHDHYLRLAGQLVRQVTAEEQVTFRNLNVRPKPNPYAHFQHPAGPPHTRFAIPAPPPGYEVSARRQTVVTPSGISVTLLPFSTLPQNRPYFGGMSNSIQMLLKFSGAAPGMAPVSLPRSPLTKRYHKPVMLMLGVARPWVLQSMFPLSGYSPFLRGGPAGQEYIVTLMLPPVPMTMQVRNGRPLPGFAQPAVPRHLNAVTLTLSQRAELNSTPISFLVPIQNQPPPMPGVPFHRPVPARRR